jgi:AcrR family transcriptional regulator
MVAAASTHGYAGATVSRVVGLAGVSRATFYELFGDRDECFQEAYRTSLEGVRAAVRAVAETSASGERPEAVLDVLLKELASRPAVARLILVEALAAPPPIRKGHEGLIRQVDREIAAFLDSQPPTGALQVPATALLGGAGEALATRMLAEPGSCMSQLRGELVEWMDSYRLPEGVDPVPQGHWIELGRFSKGVRRRAEQAMTLLPRGRTALPPEDAAGLRRKRILDATVRLIAREGYAGLTVGRIAVDARIPRSAFYSHFEDKEEALLAVQTEGMQGAIAVTAAEYSPTAPWPERGWRSLRALLTYIGENPDHARLQFVESYAAGQAATMHRRQHQRVFGLFLEEGYRQSSRAERLPRFCSEAIGAAMFGLIRKLVIEGKTDRMLSLLPAAAYTVLAPFLGPQAALEQVQAFSRGAG